MKRKLEELNKERMNDNGLKNKYKILKQELEDTHKAMSYCFQFMDDYPEYKENWEKYMAGLEQSINAIKNLFKLSNKKLSKSEI